MASLRNGVDGEVTVEIRNDFEDDVERQDNVNLKIGSAFQLDAVQMRVEATVLGESTMLASAGSRF